MNLRQTRKLVRWLHLVGAGLIGAFVYSPWSDVAWFAALVKWGVIPLLTLSGLWMWQGHKLRAKPPAES